MKKNSLVGLAKELRRQRDVLYKTVADTEVDLQALQELRESELEELAQDERMTRLFARLDVRGKHEIESIDAALARIADGTYGKCTSCGKPIAPERLRALPATLYCIDCARGREAPLAGSEEEAETPRRGTLPPDFSLLTDREVETSLREMVSEDGRIDTEELRLVSRHGVVYLDGAVPSEGEHQILLKLLTDVAGVREVVDRLQTNKILWERGERDKESVAGNADGHSEPPSSEDIVETLEDGTEYAAPGEPTTDEE